MPGPTDESGAIRGAKWSLPSGLPASELGFAAGRGWIDLPIGLCLPEEPEGDQLLRSLPGEAARPAWWSGRAERQDLRVVVSIGALSLNSQLLPVLRAAEAVGARGLAVVAPVVSDEALATLLVNDVARAFPRGILPLRTLVPEWHVDEAIEMVAGLLKVAPWDGRPDTVALAGVARLSAGSAGTRVWLETESRLRRVARRLLLRG